MEDINIELRKVLESAVHSTQPVEYDGATLKDLYQQKLVELKMTGTQIENLLDISHKSLLAILNNTGERIDVINVIKLAHFLGLSVNDIMKLYVPNMPTEQIGEIQKAREAGYIISNFDIPTMKKIGFFTSSDLQTTQSLLNIKKRIISFFGLSTIYDYTETSIFPAFSRSKRNSNDLIRAFWINSAYRHFELINNPHPYKREALLKLMPNIRPYSRNEKNGLRIVAKALFNVGVTVIFQESLPKLQTKGATFSYNNKPCIVLSDLNKRYPTLWHVLLHELHHVLYDFDEILEQSYHITGEDDLFLINEVAADAFASDYFLSKDRLKYISPYINSRIIVDKCAQEWGVHPSIIYAAYCYNLSEQGNKKAWKLPITKYIPPMDIALELFNTHPFEKESLLESVKIIKELIYNI